jgi:hypothetical protein
MEGRGNNQGKTLSAVSEEIHLRSACGRGAGRTKPAFGTAEFLTSSPPSLSFRSPGDARRDSSTPRQLTISNGRQCFRTRGTAEWEKAPRLHLPPSTVRRMTMTMHRHPDRQIESLPRVWILQLPTLEPCGERKGSHAARVVTPARTGPVR